MNFTMAGFDNLNWQNEKEREAQNTFITPKY